MVIAFGEIGAEIMLGCCFVGGGLLVGGGAFSRCEKRTLRFAVCEIGAEIMLGVGGAFSCCEKRHPTAWEW
jgi:hypothetical protein